MIKLSWIKTKADREINKLFKEVEELNLPKAAMEELARLYKESLRRKLSLSYPKKEIKAALTYYVSQLYKTPYTLLDIESFFGVKKKRIYSVLKFLRKELNLKQITHDISKYIIRFGSEMKIPEEIITEALKESTKASNPRLKAALALIKAAEKKKYKINKSKLSKIAGVSLTAIRKQLKR